MRVEIVYPKSEILKKHIEFFTFLQTSSEVEVDLLLFPTILNVFSLTPHTRLEIQNNTVTVNIDPKIKGIQSDIAGRFLVPLHFRYLGKCNEICVTFKPLGIEHFFSKNLNEIAPQNYQSFKPDFEDWDNFTQKLFESDIQTNQLELLENYFLRKIRNPQLQYFEEVIDYLRDFEENISIREISLRTGLHQKKIERLCKKHLGCSAATFRRIIRFRHSINLKLTENESLDLTAASHQSNFFDQSHFNKEFRRLSNMTPKEFFGSTWKLPQYGIVWKLR